MAEAANPPEPVARRRLRRLATGFFFGLLLLAGWRLAPDYGSFVDESSCWESGQVTINYLYSCLPPRWLPARVQASLAALPDRARLLRYPDRDYGVAFEVPVDVVIKLSGTTDRGAVLVLRHRLVWVACWLGCLAFYKLARRRLGHWALGLLAVGLLLLSPRVAADFFYNAKDAVFLAAYLVASATALAFVQRPGWGTAAAHALACALAIDVRIPGCIVPVLTLGLLGLRALRGDYAGQPRTGRAVALYAALLPLLVVACWPYLWSAPVAHFRQAFGAMSRFALTRWAAPILYRGVLLPAGTRLPWHYPLVWMGLTTPLLYLAGLLLSLGGLLRQLARRGYRLYATTAEWQDLLLWGLGAGPLLAVLVFQSRLYDGWRQLYFVYPPLLLLALRGLVAAWRWPALPAAWRPGWHALAAGLLLASLGTTAWQARQLHPLENLYFNALAGAHPERRYEYDYWGLSLRQAEAWIASHDARPLIRIRTNTPPGGFMDAYLLPPAQQQRLTVAVMDTTGPADYFITTYRFHPQPYRLGCPVDSLRVGAERRRVYDTFRLR